jgi:hypothetical protein
MSPGERKRRVEVALERVGMARGGRARWRVSR